ncbi:MAG: carbon-nitrogen hydrolase family protein [Chloroflexales bacterium]|nr:carbon-nitrogen hydrolase family protein [Chloroflexales bacterium]
MPRTVTIAAVQMDANPAPTSERLARARRLVHNAATAGAQLVVLPELFNTGYAYAETNFANAETLDGPTIAWLRATAAELGIHLAGTLLLRDSASRRRERHQRDIFNALLLVAPDGRMWRYDKRYPCAWERGYFRPGRRDGIAQTDLGAIGMLICWDSAHRNLWRAFAGQVDLVLISSCPPELTQPTYHFPNGARLTFDDLGPLLGRMRGGETQVFGEMINAQSAWLGVPAVNTVGAGRITTAIPNGLATLLAFLPLAPAFAPYLPQARQLQMSCDLAPGCKVVSATGAVLAEVPAGASDAFTVATVPIPEARPRPQAAQPRSPVPWLSYLSADVILPWLTIPVYRRGARRAWGPQIAPPGRGRWLALAGLGLLGMVVGLAHRAIERRSR